MGHGILTGNVSGAVVNRVIELTQNLEETNQKLSTAEGNIEANSTNINTLDGKVTELEEDLATFSTDEIGDIKITARSDLGSKWKLCDGSEMSQNIANTLGLPYENTNILQSTLNLWTDIGDGPTNSRYSDPTATKFIYNNNKVYKIFLKATGNNIYIGVVEYSRDGKGTINSKWIYDKEFFSYAYYDYFESGLENVNSLVADICQDTGEIIIAAHFAKSDYELKILRFIISISENGEELLTNIGNTFSPFYLGSTTAKIFAGISGHLLYYYTIDETEYGYFLVQHLKSNKTTFNIENKLIYDSGMGATRGETLFEALPIPTINGLLVGFNITSAMCELSPSRYYSIITDKSDPIDVTSLSTNTENNLYSNDNLVKIYNVGSMSMGNYEYTYNEFLDILMKDKNNTCICSYKGITYIYYAHFVPNYDIIGQLEISIDEDDPKLLHNEIRTVASGTTIDLRNAAPVTDTETKIFCIDNICYIAYKDSNLSSNDGMYNSLIEFAPDLSQYSNYSYVGSTLHNITENMSIFNSCENGGVSLFENSMYFGLMDSRIYSGFIPKFPNIEMGSARGYMKISD